MINFNGEIISETALRISKDNRAFKYGDAIFETIRVLNTKVVFMEDHYFRLMASMRMLRMKIPMKFTLEFLQEEILKVTNELPKSLNYRVRLTVYRKDGGLYNPASNDIDYLIEASEFHPIEKTSYKIDLYKDFYNYSGLLSTIKTTNRMLNTLSAVFADENDLDNCILLNERKGVVEATNGNIFVIKDGVIKTPALTEGCIKGVTRKKVLEILEKHPNYTVEETVISPFELQKADEIFITNAIIGIQSVTNYRKKVFTSEITNKIKSSLKLLAITG
ncbi:aminotransferase class IV [Tenacibaculum finnmarkense]|uniref:branched-chain-amino-acid transaminase n=1 Tax=Tenacibaculum finnmarkense genomovar ulcerans TaxID=2781388 RepID=A0A2I2MAC6_9FLAO|nr:aminotransferase class IV [Tenacibaculum finnmarkense]ALU74354.1 aminotransferase class IV [Tenacibaculum dicentrarchi]MBE7634574.1 aminotransferase class IV [Tenacibaculum finnmarkense genomovar ulcerans]MBE7698329.1 aminotransferase class IV [Tenacibaculum finnmarkense genomovar ulcerans]MCD8430377.1 aminotransferase class IV [Tenacibaculum finnmarkense genomovar ulcerans]SOU89499.1 Aminotransferase class IV [Tenacibaculum finnmarkense genomovar ulcerans]